MTQTKNLTSKTVGPYTLSGEIATSPESVATPAYTVYRFVDADGKGGCWYSTIEKAELSWSRLHPIAQVPA